MAYAQTNPLSLTEGRLLEGEKGLAYWCMPTFLHSLFLLLILFFFLHFVTFILSPFFLSFLVLTRVVLWWRWCCNSLMVVATVVMMILCTARALYILPTMTFFTILAFNYFCLDLGVLPNHLLVCQLLGHHHLLVVAVPPPITRQRKLFYLLVHRGILIHNSVGILSCYPSWHAPSVSNSSFPLLGGMSSQ